MPINCPKCGSTLNNDEKASGKCFSCGETFESNIPQKDKVHYVPTEMPIEVPTERGKNTIGKIIKCCGILIIILGTFYSIMLANDGKYEYHFSFLLFIIPEIISCISGLLFIGLSEIIQLLDDIKSSLKNT